MERPACRPRHASGCEPGSCNLLQPPPPGPALWAGPGRPSSRLPAGRALAHAHRTGSGGAPWRRAWVGLGAGPEAGGCAGDGRTRGRGSLGRWRRRRRRTRTGRWRQRESRGQLPRCTRAGMRVCGGAALAQPAGESAGGGRCGPGRWRRGRRCGPRPTARGSRPAATEGTGGTGAGRGRRRVGAAVRGRRGSWATRDRRVRWARVGVNVPGPRVGVSALQGLSSGRRRGFRGAVGAGAGPPGFVRFGGHAGAGRGRRAPRTWPLQQGGLGRPASLPAALRSGILSAAMWAEGVPCRGPLERQAAALGVRTSFM